MAGPRLAFTVQSRATGAREACALLRTWLAAGSCAQDAIEIAELLVTELVSKALKHTDSAEVGVSAHLQGRRVRVAVGDGMHQGLPAPPTDVSADDVAGGCGWSTAR